MIACGTGPGWMRSALGLAALAAIAWSAGAAEVIPPSPPGHFNDYAGVVSPSTAAKLETTLDDFERATSNQIVVVIYPTMQSDSSVEDYTVRVAQAWHAGLKGRDNGAVLFVFKDSHQIRLQVGYGLEPVLTDALSQQIISNEIVPRFKQGDFDGGLTAGVNAIILATRGEYKGTGRTVADGRGASGRSAIPFVIFLVLFIFMTIIRMSGTVYHGGGSGFATAMLMSMFLNRGGGSGGGGGGGFGGGGFSGGGGGFGGGGAGGSW